MADPELEDVVESSGQTVERPQDPASAVQRLIQAASGLASTLAVTDQLMQQRADILTRGATFLGPMREGVMTHTIVPLAEAARRSGRNPEVLRRWCAEGRIPAVRHGRAWGLTEETVALLITHRARSRPRLSRSSPS